MQLVIIGKNEFKTKAGGNGQSYIALKRDNKLVEIRADEFENEVHEGVDEFTNRLAVDVPVKISLFQEKISYKQTGEAAPIE